MWIAAESGERSRPDSGSVGRWVGHVAHALAVVETATPGRCPHGIG